MNNRSSVRATPGELCPDCDLASQRGQAAPARYCAPLRCYCGHEACHAYPSFVHTRASRR